MRGFAMHPPRPEPRLPRRGGRRIQGACITRTGPYSGVDERRLASAVRGRKHGEMKIVGMTPDDYAAIVEDLASYWGSDRTRHLHHPMFVREFADSAFVARDAEQLVGYLMGFRSQVQPVGYIHLVAVRRDHRETGVARQLYRAFATAIGNHGAGGLKVITTRRTLLPSSSTARSGSSRSWWPTTRVRVRTASPWSALWTGSRDSEPSDHCETSLSESRRPISAGNYGRSASASREHIATAMIAPGVRTARSPQVASGVLVRGVAYSWRTCRQASAVCVSIR
jgi:GNAT superfamily N-acetyltransferase